MRAEIYLVHFTTSSLHLKEIASKGFKKFIKKVYK